MNNILNEPVEIRLGKAKNKKTDPELLEVLSHDSFWFVRNLVAANPNTLRNTLDNLLKDSDFRVQFEAQKNINSRKLDLLVESAAARSNGVNKSNINSIEYESKR